jgi:hypothetical protein
MNAVGGVGGVGHTGNVAARKYDIFKHNMHINFNLMRFLPKSSRVDFFFWRFIWLMATSTSCITFIVRNSVL